MRPLIGVTTSEMRRSDMSTLRRHGDPPHPEMALGMTYLQAIERAGGMPVVLPPLSPGDVPRLLDRFDGICLSGGPDLDPAAYGVRYRHPELGTTEPALDAFELAVAREADRRGMPLLGICRGAQSLNVARGGTLHQHLPGHRQAEMAGEPTHDVQVAWGSRLARTLGTTRLRVNSFHHQAVAETGAGLRVSARAPDGTIEGIECGEHPFLVGVQWHAETLVSQPAHLSLFSALVTAASRHAALPAGALPRAA